MGRSVSTPSDARHVLYLYWTDGHEDEDGNPVDPYDYDYWQNEWDYLADDDYVGNVLKDLFPSVEGHEEWIGREDRVVARNGHALFGVSEYCGIAAFWVVVNPDVDYGWDDRTYRPLAERWIDQAWPKVEAMYPHRLQLAGRFSNGEAVYSPIEKGE